MLIVNRLFVHFFKYLNTDCGVLAPSGVNWQIKQHILKLIRESKQAINVYIKPCKKLNDSLFYFPINIIIKKIISLVWSRVKCFGAFLH